MTTVPYSDFTPYVLPFIRSAPDIAIETAVKNACIEFCEETQYWTTSVTLDAVAGQADYVIPTPSGTIPSRPLEVWYQQTPLTAKTEEDLRRMFSLDWRDLESKPTYYTQLSRDAVTLVPRPNLAGVGAIEIIVSLRPSRSATEVDADVYERWAEVIAHGARYRLHETPDQPYSDEALAQKYLAFFRAGIGKAKIERNRGLTRATTRVRPPRLF